ncbi:MAG: hypothetical protein IJ269_04395 [Bacteroidales bacterium]|nr:hypothetical protein [Bacteroidales bacterium]
MWNTDILNIPYDYGIYDYVEYGYIEYAIRLWDIRLYAIRLCGIRIYGIYNVYESPYGHNRIQQYKGCDTMKQIYNIVVYK